MSGLTVLQLDGGARGSVQIVSCGCLLSQVVQFWVSEVENWSVTFVEKKCQLWWWGGVFVCVHCQFRARCVCVLGGWACQVGFGIWVASQMPNQLDKGMLDSPGKMKCVTCVERSVQLCLS